MNLAILTTSRVWTALGWTMLHVIWAGAVVGLLAALVRRLANPASPETRYGVALVCLAVLAGSPIVIFVRVLEPPPSGGIASPRSVGTNNTANGPAVVSPSSGVSVKLESRILTGPGPVQGASRWRLEAVVPYLPWIWLCGSLSALVIMATGFVGIERLRRSSYLLKSGEIPGRLRLLADSLGIAQRVSIGVCDRLAVPVLMGIVRPMILLPPAALSGLSVEQLEMVLLHELAHLGRWDNLVNLVQRLVESLLFFQPAVWWLSGWVRLERELCCDRLVVKRVRQPLAYAEMLLSLSGSYCPRGTVLAMADSQVSARIRHVLNMKERSMKLDMPEGLGVLGAVIIDAALILKLQAAQPQALDQSQDSVRQALRKAVDDVGVGPPTGLDHAAKMQALSLIAQAQLKVGDREAALATLGRAYQSIDRSDPKTSKAGRLDVSNAELLGALCQMAKHQREAGDMDTARKTLDRIAKIVESLESTPIVEGLYQIKDAADPKARNEAASAAIRSELHALVADERLALGDRDAARALYRRAAADIAAQSAMMKAIVLSAIGSRLLKAGDPVGGRDLIDQSRQVARELPDRDSRDGAISYIASALAETGDLDGALKLVETIGGNHRQTAARRILETMTDDDRGRPWLVTGGIKITIGADSLRMKDPKCALTALPKIAQAVRSLDDPLLQVRALSMIAHLQAKSSDFAGALQSIDSMPDITRQQFPGPSNGFYDAVKPATLAKVGRLQFLAADRAGALNAFNRAISLSRAINSAGERIIAQIVVVQEQLKCGFRDEARALLREAIPFASRQVEPLRSRGLAMLCSSQVQSGDAVEAQQTIDMIRCFPGLERVQALRALARWYRKKGDRAAERAIYRDALRCLAAKEPAGAKTDKTPPRNLGPFTVDSFVDFESDFPPGLVEHERQMAAMFLHCELGETDQAIKVGRTMPGGSRAVALSNLAGAQARNGDISGAFKLAASFETAQERLTAYEVVACVIRDCRKDD